MGDPAPYPAPNGLVEKIIGPSVLTRLPMDKLAEQPLLSARPHFPPTPWVKARHDKHGRQLPQAIAHRGYKAKFPENTMAAFEGAVQVGAHALETDIHLTKDGVVVLSHDATLKRCFGRPEKLLDLEWEEISQLETLAEPKQHMPRLIDLLEYLARPGLEHLWVLLDIKLDNDADKVMRLIGETIQSVTPAEKRAWNDRVVLGIWATKYLTFCDEYLPGFPVSHIGFSTTYAWLFFHVPNVCFNMLQVNMMGPFGAAFLRKAKSLNREVFGWTVNQENRMRWCIRKQLDGVITDDPKKFLEVCENYTPDARKESLGWRELYQIVKVHVFTTIWAALFRLKFGYGLDQRFITRPRKTMDIED